MKIERNIYRAFCEGHAKEAGDILQIQSMEIKSTGRFVQPVCKIMSCWKSVQPLL